MTKQQLHQIENLLQRLDAAVVVRDPGNARAAEAYEGLRKQLIRSSTNHRSHIAHLLSLSDSLKREASMELIRDRVSDFLAELGVKFISDYSHPDLFEIVETVHGEAHSFEVLESAVIEHMDDGSIMAIRPGKVREIQGPAPEVQTKVEDLEIQAEPTVVIQSNSRALRSSLLAAAALIIGLVLGMFVFDGVEAGTIPTVGTTIATPQIVDKSSTTVPNGSTTSLITTTTGA